LQSFFLAPGLEQIHTLCALLAIRLRVWSQTELKETCTYFLGGHRRTAIIIVVAEYSHCFKYIAWNQYWHEVVHTFSTLVGHLKVLKVLNSTDVTGEVCLGHEAPPSLNHRLCSASNHSLITSLAGSPPLLALNTVNLHTVRSRISTNE